MRFGREGVPFGEDGLPEGWPQDHDIPSLGPTVLAWGECNLLQPDGDMTGDPWEWRDSQARFICWWYALNDDGTFIFRRGQIVLPKGTGKSPLAAALACCALLGPVKFSHFDETGYPIGVPNRSPFVQLAAVSQDQTDNTFSLVMAMLRYGQVAESNPTLDVGATRVKVSNGKLVPVTASAPSREGGRTTDAILDETHLWLAANGGHSLASTIRRNLGKMNGRSIETTNTWSPGTDSVAERTSVLADKIREELTDDQGILRWHPHVHVEDLADELLLRAGIAKLYADAPWVNQDRIVDEIYDEGTSPADSRRFYLNEVSQSDDQWITQPEWAGCLGLDLQVADKDTIVVGFDGSRRRNRGITDATALIGCRVSDGFLFEIKVWEQPEGPAGASWSIPYLEVNAAVDMVFATYNVVGLYADPAKWESHIAGWEAKYSERLLVKAGRDNPMHWWMTGGRATLTVRALDQFRTAVAEKQFKHDGAFALTRHILNAQQRVSKSGIQIAKEHPDSARKIDAAVAATLAWAARIDAIAAGVAATTKRSKALMRF